MPSKTATNKDFARLKGELIESIYAILRNQDGWQTFLKQLVDATSSRSARMLVMNAEADRVISSIKTNIDDSCHQQYVDYYVNSCPWRPELSRMSRGRLYSTYLHFTCSQSAYYKTKFFNEWARPQDIHHGMCGTIFQDSRRKVQLLIQRTQGQGHYSEQETAFVTSLVPYIQHSLQLAWQISNAQSRAEAVSTAAELETMPFILLNSSLKIVYQTPEAESLLRQNNSIYTANSILRIRDALHDQCFSQLLQECLSAARDRSFHTAGGNFFMPRPGDPDLLLLVRPVHPDIPVLLQEPFVYIVVYLHDPAAKVHLNPEYLRLVYALSRAEIKVLQAIIITSDSEEAARKCCISLHTLRSHLKAIFSKTGTHNRVELMKRLLTGPSRRR